MDITQLSAFDMKKKLHEREISSRDLIEAHFDKIESRENDINAFINLNKEAALEKADQVDRKIKEGERLGLLAGLPIGLKDNIITKDLKTTCGSKMLENFLPPYNATIVERILEADGVIMGKTNMDEFAMGSSTEHSYFGPVKNPINKELVPGGSSGGSAAAVRDGQIALGVGTDTGGSVRQPASFCNLVGITPSYGIVSRYGVVPLANSLDQMGVFGRDVKDAVLILSSITGYDSKDSTSFNNPEGTIIFQSFTKEPDLDKILKGVRIALPKEVYNIEMDKGIKEELENSIRLLEKLGARVEEVSLAHLEYSLAAYQVISTAEISSNMARFDGVRYGHRAEDYNSLDELYINSRTEGLGEEVKRRILLGTYYLSQGHSKEIYHRALRLRRLIKEDFDQVFKDYHIVLTPTSPILPFKLGDKKKRPMEIYQADSFTSPVNLAGLCAINLPGNPINGLPFGLQMIGNRFKEADIVKTAMAFEGGIKHGL